MLKYLPALAKASRNRTSDYRFRRQLSEFRRWTWSSPTPHFVLWPPPRRDFLKERGSRNCVGQRSDRRISGEGAIGAPWLLPFSTCRFTRLGGRDSARAASIATSGTFCGRCRRRPHGLIARGNLEHGVTEDRVVLLVVAGRQRQVHVSERATLLRQRLHEPALQLDAPALRDGEDDSGIWR